MAMPSIEKLHYSNEVSFFIADFNNKDSPKINIYIDQFNRKRYAFGIAFNYNPSILRIPEMKMFYIGNSYYAFDIIAGEYNRRFIVFNLTDLIIDAALNGWCRFSVFLRWLDDIVNDIMAPDDVTIITDANPIAHHLRYTSEINNILNILSFVSGNVTFILNDHSGFCEVTYLRASYNGTIKFTFVSVGCLSISKKNTKKNIFVNDFNITATGSVSFSDSKCYLVSLVDSEGYVECNTSVDKASEYMCIENIEPLMITEFIKSVEMAMICYTNSDEFGYLTIVYQIYLIKLKRKLNKGKYLKSHTSTRNMRIYCLRKKFIMRLCVELDNIIYNRKLLSQ